MAPPEITLFSVVGPISRRQLEHFVEHYQRHGIQNFSITFHFDDRVPDEKVQELEAAARELMVDYTTARGEWREDVNRKHLVEMRAKSPSKWHLLADSDEFAVPTAGKTFAQMAEDCEKVGWRYVRGMLLDRVAEGGVLKPWPNSYEELDTTFPYGGFFTSEVLHGEPNKVVLARKDLQVGPGNHTPKTSERGLGSEFEVPVHHFKWDDGVHTRLAYRVVAGKGRGDAQSTRNESMRIVTELAKHQDKIDLSACEFRRVSLRAYPEDWADWAREAVLKWERWFMEKHAGEYADFAVEELLQGPRRRASPAGSRALHSNDIRIEAFSGFENVETARAFSKMVLGCTRPTDVASGRPFPPSLRNEQATEGLLRGWLTDPHAVLIAAVKGDSLVGFAHARPGTLPAEVEEVWRGASTEFAYDGTNPPPGGYTASWKLWTPAVLNRVLADTAGNLRSRMLKASPSGPLPMLRVGHRPRPSAGQRLMAPTVLVVTSGGTFSDASNAGSLKSALPSLTLFVPRGLAFADERGPVFGAKSSVLPMNSGGSTAGLGYLTGLARASGWPTAVAVDSHIVGRGMAVTQMVVLERVPKRPEKGAGPCEVDTYISGDAGKFRGAVEAALQDRAVAVMAGFGYEPPAREMASLPQLKGGMLFG